MTDKGRPEDDDENERETIAGDTSVPRDTPTEPDADFVSLPPRAFPARPPSSPPPARKLPEPDPDEPPTGEASPTMAEPTMAEPTLAEPAAPTEAPTKEVDVEREMPTIVGSFASSSASNVTAAPSDEAETMLEPGSAGPSAAPRATPGTGDPPRTPAYRSPLGKGGASRTARDPVVGSAASRGTTPGGGAVTVSLAEGQLLADRYELIERLGKGGMGEVWKAKHTLLQGMRAIKVIKASISKDPSFRQRFLQEGQTMMRVKHAGVVEVTDLDETRQNRELFMVMEYLKGRTIYDAVRSKDRPLATDVRNAVRVLVEVAEGMQVIHDERIVHKDLKTDNVLLVVGEDGLEHPKVIDFGLAKRLGDDDTTPAEGTMPSPAISDSDLRTTLSGTLAYMAPEQFRHEPSSFQSDIYAFGVMAYEVFTKGEYPVPRGSLQHYLELHTKGTDAGRLARKRPDLDPKLTAILDRCTETDKARRPESFRSVAEDLQYWLDTPARLARRRRIALMSTGVAAIALFGLWAYFFGGEKTASLSNLALSSEGASFTFDGKTAHLPGAALAGLTLTADIAGKAGETTLEIDGSRRPVKSTLRGGKIIVTTDLSDLADGTHEMALRASATAAPVTAVLAVDRAAPDVASVSVIGGVVTPEGEFTNSESPELVVDVKEPTARIASVYALGEKGARFPGEREPGSDRWIVKGTAAGDGPVAAEVVVRDLAGNESRRKSAYVRDVRKPLASIRDVFTCWPDKPTNRTEHRGLFVRSPSGSKLVVAVDEPCDVIARFGGAEQTAHVAAAGEVSMPIPDVPATGLATDVVVRDRAGNEFKDSFPVEALEEGVRVMAQNMLDELAIDGRVPAMQQNAYVIVAGSFPIVRGFELHAEPLLDAAGAPVAAAGARPVQLDFLRETDEGKTHVFVVKDGSFADGTYRLGVSIPGVKAVRPMTLVVDSAPAEFGAVTVIDDETKQAVAPAGWLLHPKVRVTAEIADLSPRRVDLSGTPPLEKPEPGRRTYTFVKTLEQEGDTQWTLSVADAANHPREMPVAVRGDWSTPAIELTDPTATSEYNDVDLVAFAGRCSEPRFKLHVELPEGEPLKANCSTAQFDQRFQLPAGEPLVVAVSAEDDAGHRSPPTTLRLRVAHRATELPPEIAWTRGVTAKMEKVERGDVVIGGRVRPVSLSFVDRCEVTNRDYRAFLEATGGGHGAWCAKDEPKGWDHTPAAATWKDPKWNGDDLPVVNVAYWDAHAFAVWSGRRLPTEAEWVKAAAKSRAPGETELRMWPPFAAGEDWKNGVVVTSDWAKAPASALAGGDVSPVGCLHMGGNVSEWVELPEAVDGSAAGTRGGNWFFSRRAADIRGTPAKAWAPSFRANTIGFRCAVDAELVRP